MRRTILSTSVPYSRASCGPAVDAGNAGWDGAPTVHPTMRGRGKRKLRGRSPDHDTYHDADATRFPITSPLKTAPDKVTVPAHPPCLGIYIRIQPIRDAQGRASVFATDPLLYGNRTSSPNSYYCPESVPTPWAVLEALVIATLIVAGAWVGYNYWEHSLTEGFPLRCQGSRHPAARPSCTVRHRTPSPFQRPSSDTHHIHSTYYRSGDTVTRMALTEREQLVISVANAPHHLLHKTQRERHPPLHHPAQVRAGCNPREHERWAHCRHHRPRYSPSLAPARKSPPTVHKPPRRPVRHGDRLHPGIPLLPPGAQGRQGRGGWTPCLVCEEEAHQPLQPLPIHRPHRPGRYILRRYLDEDVRLHYSPTPY